MKRELQAECVVFVDSREVVMSGIFRYGKGIAASLTLAAVSLGLKYAQSWVFRSVEHPDAQPGIVWVTGESRSPQRILRNDGDCDWRIAFVTNRIASDVDLVAPGNRSLSEGGRALSDQVVDLLYAMPRTTYGAATVRVPTSRERGQFTLESDHAARVDLTDMQEMTQQRFLSDVVGLLSQDQAADVLVFVHGFNVTLDQAVARAAQMVEDMPFHGVVIAFSWQSVGRTDAYLADEILAERYFWNLAELLAALRTELPESARLHLLAHSMGNRVALRALNALAGTIDPAGRELSEMTAHRLRNRPVDSSTPFRIVSGVVDGVNEIPRRFPQWGIWTSEKLREPPLSNLILAAPDVDCRDFGHLFGRIRHTSRRCLLYASDTDFALEASRKVHQGQFRAGDSRAKLRVEGLNLIRVSGVDSFDPLGHSYYGSNAQVLSQLATLLNTSEFDLTRPIGSGRPVGSGPARR